MLPLLRSVAPTSTDREPATRQFLPWQDAFETPDYVISAASNHPEVTSSDFRQSTRPTLVGILPGNGRILCGVAVLESDLYVVRNFSSTIDVYDVRTRDFRSRGAMGVAGLRDPVDIAACPVRETVYVAGSNDMSVFKIDGRSKTTTGRWRLDRRPFGVSVTRRSTVIVTFLDETAVREFSADGAELRGVRLDPDAFANPWHAVAFSVPGAADEPTTDRVLLCHGWSKDVLTCVSVVDVAAGRLVGRYGGARGSGRAGMDLPSHAVVVEGSGGEYALVVDLNNSRVLRLRLLSASAENGPPPEVESVLLSDADGLKWPRSIAFDEPRQRLFVGLHEGPVLVFDYRPKNI